MPPTTAPKPRESTERGRAAPAASAPGKRRYSLSQWRTTGWPAARILSM